MPYIITTGQKHEASGRFDKLSDRRAVATLDEALDHAAEIVVKHGDPFDVSALPPMPEQGGTVGPLPDGTVIEVEQVMLDRAFTAAAGLSRADTIYLSDARLIDAYNTAQGERV